MTSFILLFFFNLAVSSLAKWGEDFRPLLGMTALLLESREDASRRSASEHRIIGSSEHRSDCSLLKIIDTYCECLLMIDRPLQLLNSSILHPSHLFDYTIAQLLKFSNTFIRLYYGIFLSHKTNSLVQ